VDNVVSVAAKLLTPVVCEVYAILVVARIVRVEDIKEK